VVRGLELYDGGPSSASNHGSFITCVISNPHSLYEDIQTAINSKADKASPTIDEPTFTDWVKLPGYADAAARDVAIAVPANNMTVILEDDGNGYTCLSVYRNAQWNNIALPSEDVTIEGFLDVNTGYFKLPVYADDAARNAAIPAPVLSQMVWNSTADTAQLYTSGGWDSLDLGTATPLASDTNPGKVELATNTEAINRTDFNGPNPLVVQPSQLDFATIISAIAEEDLAAGDLVGVSPLISQTDTYVTKAGRTQANAVFPSVVNRIFKVIALDSTRLFVLYQTTSGNLLSGVVVTYDQDTNSVTAVGSKVDFATAALVGTVAADVALIDTDKVAVTYVLNATNTVIRVRPATISGAVITMGLQQDLITLGTAYLNSLQILNINTDKAVVCANATTAVDSKVIAFSVSGTTITPGVAETPTTNVRTAGVWLVKLDTDKFILVRSSATTGYANVGTVSTITTTLSSEQTFTTGGTTDDSSAVSIAIATDKIITTYRSTGSSSVDRMVCITVSGTTVTANTPITIAETPLPSLCKTSDNNFLFKSNNGNLLYEGVVTGSTIALTQASFFNFETIDVFGTNARGFDIVNNRVVGLASINTTTVPLKTITMAHTFIGQALETVSRGSTVNIKLKSSPMDNSAGLRGGELYGVGNANFASTTSGYLNGVLTMVDPFANAGSASFIAANTVMVALNEDTIVAI
jgi:hypothetical protein